MQTDVTADVIVTAAQVHAGFDHVVLFEEQLVPVASPTMPTAPNGLPLRLITTDVAQGTVGQDWRDYAERTGRDYLGATTGPFLRCTHYLLALSLAKAGMGAALVPDFLADAPVAAGDLVRLDRATMPSDRTYRICYKSMRAGDPAIRTLVRWMKAQRDAAAGP